MTDEPGYVYFVSCGSAVKIGWTGGDPKERMSDLQGANPRALALLHTVPGDRKLEKTLHRALKAFRLRGEWFAPEPGMIAKVRELLDDPGALKNLLRLDEEIASARKMLDEAGELLRNETTYSADFDRAVQLIHDAGFPQIRSLLLRHRVTG